jgi:hypothetical protein
MFFVLQYRVSKFDLQFLTGICLKYFLSGFSPLNEINGTENAVWELLTGIHPTITIMVIT